MSILDLRQHLQDLSVLATSSAETSGATARDVVVSIENSCKNALDDEVSGAVSLLFERSGGLTSLLMRSLENIRRNDEDMRQLRSEIFKLIDWLILDQRAREGHTHVAEYVVSIVDACMRTFFKETSSKVSGTPKNPLTRQLVLTAQAAVSTLYTLLLCCSVAGVAWRLA